LKSPNDLIAFMVHMSFLENCKLIGLSQDQYLEDIGSIPQGWNRSSDLYTFRYIEKNNNNKDNNNTKDKDKEDSKEDNKEHFILVTIIQLEENNLIISAIRDGSETVITLDIIVSDHINKEQKITSEDNDNDNNKNIESCFKDISILNSLIKDKITNKIFNGKEKEKEKVKEMDLKDKDKNKNKEETNNNELIFFDDDFGTNPNPNLNDYNHPSSGTGIGGIGGGDFGRDIDPLRIGGGIGGGIGRGIGGIGGGVSDIDMGGNLMGPNHSRFRGGMSGSNNSERPGVPNGARFDDYGPGSLGSQPGPDPDHMIPPTQGGNRRGRGRGSGNNDPFGMFL